MTATATDGSGPAAASSVSALLVVRAAGERLAIWDRSCGRCVACVAGCASACSSPVAAPPSGDVAASGRWRWRPDGGAFAADLPALTAAAITHDLLVNGAIAGPAVLVRGRGSRGRAAVAAATGAGARIVAWAAAADELPTSRDDATGPGTDTEARERLAATSESGRADVVLAADGDLERAARLVRRGGTVATLGVTRSRPSVTTIVQRELELPNPRDLVQAAVNCRLPTPSAAFEPRTPEGADHGQ